MGLSFHYEFAAPADTTAEELERFLLDVEQLAQSIGFNPTQVLNAAFDTPERRGYSRRLGGSVRFQHDGLKGDVRPAEGQIRNHLPTTGECALIPIRGVNLILTDERGCETCFGFFKFHEEILDVLGHMLASTEMNGAWAFRDFVNSADMRYRQIVSEFARAGYVKRLLDEFA